VAQADIFLKLDGAEGESTDDKHKSEIEISSFSWGASMAHTVGSAGGGAGAGKVLFHDLTLTKKTDKSSSVLAQKCCSGDHFTKGVLTARKAGGQQQEYLKVTLDTIFITSYNINGAEGTGGTSNETISMAIGKIGIDYSPQKSDGSLAAAVHGGWDILANKKF
jgi:type VI secretion system secreted protein Hcp